MDNKIALIALNLIPEIRSVYGKRVLELKNATEIFSMSTEELVFFLRCKEEIAIKIRNGDWLEKADKEIKQAKLIDAVIITYDDKIYPEVLKKINQPPLVLYFRGNLMSNEEVCLAVVGTRYATTYGMNTTERIVSELTQNGFTIVSGLARGIDACAHNVCLKNGGRTIAVLGCGIDVDYPIENAFLREEISKKGALLTEYPLKTKPYKNNFPLRNRIISGLSIGVLIIEASYKSGSLITTRYGLEQGKDVFAIPGSIFSSQSIGTNYLIKTGQAKLIQNVNDIIVEIPNYLIKSSKVKIESPLIEVDEQEKKILQFIPFDEPIHIDDIVLLTGYNTAELLPKLLNLELKGAIAQTKGQCYCKKILI